MKNIKKNKKAFTIMELLVAVAVIVILLAVSMPAVSSLASDLKMKELDTYARTIYMEAQNQLITMRAEGGLEKLQLLMENTYSDQHLEAAPKDYAEGDSSWDQLYYINAEDLLLSDLIPAGAGFDGSFLIELNPQTGVVYSVFYQEEDAAISYETITNLADRSRDERAKNELGYFGGDVETVAKIEFDMDQQLEVVNEEELYLVISYRLSSEFARNYNEALETKVIVTGKTSGATKEFTVSNDDMLTKGSRMEKYFLLDSMLTGNTFSNIMEGSSGDFAPGENIKIEVESTYTSGAINKTETASAEVNSLFADVNGANITVSALRHLRNLDKAYYTHTGAAPQITVGSDIDFATADFDWEIGVGGCVYTGSSDSPYKNSSFAPLSNDTVFEKSGASFHGNNHVLKNFVIKVENAATGVGIIKKTVGMDISGIRVVDILVEAATSEQVGALVGSITGGTVSNCGVYLSDNSEGGGYYSDHTYDSGVYVNEMEKRYYTYTLTGSKTTGGLCGFAKNVAFNNSFAAIMVTGTGEVGGLCGTAEGGSFENCYASGDVTAASQAGGLLGKATGTAFTNCYASNEISGTGEVGGFVAISNGGTYTNCTSYASLTSATGQGVPDKTSSGVFIGSTKSTDDTFTNCVYLKQEGRNAGLTDAAGITAKYWAELVTSNAVSKCHPYSAHLTRTAFPFTMVTGTHYGNWPSQFTIDTSLVYYEVYSDNTYGYYCVTTISGGGAGAGNFTWVLDTLKDEICVEDGYALLTIYNLESFDYLLNIGSVVEGDSNYTVNTSTGSLTVANDHGTGKTKLLRQQSTLTFKGYEGTFTPETDFSTKTVRNMFSVTGMYLYQLPYELQVTNRADVNKFYDRLIIYNGKAKNNVLGPVIGGENVTDAGALTFYYCPHFAKNAINPGLWNGVEKPENPVKVSVRSARQLNALGRYVYYWNTSLGYTDRINFVQETDISFSDYVTTYCGNTFNLMDTSASNPVRNQPIGRSGVTAEGQFNNSYNGNCKKIIDYRLETDQQFVGFFGEVENGIIENIVLTVDEGGYVYGTFTGGSPDNIDRLSTVAVGGIVGLSYKTNNVIRNCAISGYEVKYISHTYADTNVTAITVGGLVGNSMSRIENCTAVCDVRVNLNGAMVPGRYGLGASISMGGLAGSAYFKQVKSCYSGGTIDISASDDAYISSINSLAAGGIAGAVLKTYHPVDASLSPATEYKDLYTYTRILIDSKFDAAGNCYIAPIVAKQILSMIAHHNRDPKLTADDITLTNCKYLDTAFNGRQDEGEDSAERTPTGTYGATEAEYGDLQVATFAGMGMVNDAAHTFPVSDDLMGKIYNLPATVKDGFGQYVHYGDWPHKVVPITLSKVYPGYFEIYEDGSVGNYYIDHNKNICSTLRNDLDITRAGYANLKLSEEVTPEDVCIGDPIYIAGKEYYICEDASITNPEHKINLIKEFTFQMVEIEDGVVTEGEPITMDIYINPEFGAAISVTEDLGRVEDNPLQVRTLEHLLNAEYVKNMEKVTVVTEWGSIWEGEEQRTAYVKQTKTLDLSELTQSAKLPDYCDYDGGKEEGFQMRDAEIIIFDYIAGQAHLHDVWTMGSKKAFIRSNGGLTEDCLVEESVVSDGGDTAIFVNENAGGTIKDCFVKNSSYHATWGNASGFAWNSWGTFDGCGIYSENDYSDTNITGNQSAGFIFNNGGTIRNCFSNVTMTTSNYTIGFVKQNTGTVENCYSNCHGYSQGNGAVGYGFVGENKATIRNCYCTGLLKSCEISQGKWLCGFGVNYGTGTMKNCYSAIEFVTLGTEVYGFGMNFDSGTTENCYWGYSDTLNVDIDGTNSVGTKIILADLAAMTTLGTLAEGETAVLLEKDNGVADIPYDNTLGTNYPYPGVVGVAHRGDWPKALGVTNRNSTLKPSSMFAGLFYYEKYTDGTYGIYADGFHEYDCGHGFPTDSTTVINTLADTTLAVEDSGYGLFYAESLTLSKWTVQDAGNVASAVALPDAGTSLSLQLSGYCFKIMANGGEEFSKELVYAPGYYDGDTRYRVLTLTKSAIDATRPAPVTP